MSQGSTSIEPVFDLASNVPELNSLRSLVRARDWTGTSAALSDIAATRGEDEFALAASVVAKVELVEKLLDKVIQEEPDNLLARSLRAHRHIVTGWEVRSRASASQVSEAHFEQFHRHLRDAEAELIELCARAPQSGLPWALRLMTARGLELGQSEAQRRYDRLAKHNPDHFTGQQQLLQRLCPKWGGTWDDAFTFARACAATATPGSPSHALVAIAHFEHWVTLPTKEQRAYLSDPTVAEIARAADQSVWDSGFGTNFHGVSAHTIFAILFSAAGAADRARRHFEALGAAADEGWLGYLGDPVREYRERRATAYAKGRR